MKKVDWYFDFISPFAYLQFSQFKKFDNELNITIHPVVFGALLKHWGQLGPAEIVPKRIFTYRFFKWKADRLGIEYTCLLYTSPSPRDRTRSRMPSSA